VPRNVIRQCGGVRRCSDVRWDVDVAKERIMTIYRDFMKGFFTRFWVEGQYKTRTTGPV